MDDNENTINNASKIPLIILLVLNLISCILTIIPIATYKKIKSETDIFTTYRKSLHIFFCIYILIFLGLDFFHHNLMILNSSLFYLLIFSDIYFKLTSRLNDYFDLIDSTKIYRSYFLKRRNYNYIIVYIFLLCIITLIGFSLPKSNFILPKNMFTYQIYCFIYFSCSICIYVILTIFLLILIFLHVKKTKILNRRKKKVTKYLRKRLIFELFDIILLSFYLIISYFIYITIYIFPKEITENSTIIILESNTFFLLFLILADSFLTSLNTFYSDFFYNLLSRTVYGKIYGIYGKNHNKVRVNNEFTIESENYTEDIEIEEFQDIYNYIDEAQYKTFDLVFITMLYSLNLCLDSINNKQCEINLSIQEKEMISQINSEQGFKSKMSNIEFRFKDDDFSHFSQKLNEVFFNSRVKVVTYFPYIYSKIISNCPMIDNLKIKGFLTEKINKLISNYDSSKYLMKGDLKINENITINFSGNELYLQVISKDFFRKKKTFFQEYPKYLESNPNSFLPLVLGVFSFRLENFEKIYFILVNNRLVSNKSNFRFWDIFRINMNSIKLEKSSRPLYQMNDLFFDDGSYFLLNKSVQLNYYDQFKKMLESDIQFLKKFQIKNFSLMVLIFQNAESLASTNQSLMNVNSSFPIIINEDISKEVIQNENLSCIRSKLNAYDESFNNEIIKLLYIKESYQAILGNSSYTFYFSFEDTFLDYYKFRHNRFYNRFSKFIFGKFN